MALSPATTATMGGSFLVLCVLLAASTGAQATSTAETRVNYFLDEQLLNNPQDSFLMPNFGFDVDILVDDFLDYVQFEFSNGTGNRLRRRVQRQGNCRNTYGDNFICTLSLVGLTVRYGSVKAITHGDEKTTTADMFVKAGSASVSMSFPRGSKSKLEVFGMYNLTMTMRPSSGVLVSPDVDKVFAQKTIENCERILWRILETDYANALAARIAEQPSIVV